MTNARIGYGTLLKQGNGASPEVFTTIAEVMDINGPGLTLDTVEATNQSSPSNHKERIAALRDSGPIGFEINWDPNAATHDASTGLVADLVARTPKNYQIVFASSPTVTWTITGLVTSFEPSAPVEDRMAATVEITPTAAPTLA